MQMRADRFQLVDREEERSRMPSGRAYPGIREVIMRQTRRTYAQTVLILLHVSPIYDVADVRNRPRLGEPKAVRHM
jgi:hypothetical protein